ncbi:unnamed protein product [Arctogadus glacialis]
MQHFSLPTANQDPHVTVHVPTLHRGEGEDKELGLVKKRDGNIMVLVWKKHTFSADIPKELNLKIIYQRMDLKTSLFERRGRDM